MALTPDLSNQFLVGTGGPDNEVLAPGQAIVYAGGVLGLAGSDTIRGSSDPELIDGGRNDDYIYGEGGNDTLTGGRNRDFLDGGFGDDFLRGGKEVDLLSGGDGNDTLLGDGDVDIYKGGAGSDTFIFRRDQAERPVSIGFGFAEVERPDAIISDFDKSSDFIAVSGGLTEANLSFDRFTLNENDPRLFLLNQVAPQTLTEGQTFLANAGITRQTIDPDGDGTVVATYIRIAGTNQLLGAVLNATPADLAGRFISII